MTLLQLPHLGPQTWDEAVADRRTTPELLDAVRFFRPILTERWKGWKNGSPFASHYGVSLQGRPQWVQLHTLCRTLDGVAGRDALIRKDLGSRQWVQFTSAVMALEFCGRFCASGASTAFVQTGASESPVDAHIAIAGRRVKVEFKSMHEPDAHERWDSVWQMLVDELAKRSRPMAGFDLILETAALRHPEAVLEGVVSAQDTSPREFVPLPKGAGYVRCTGLNVMGWQTPDDRRPDLPRIEQKLRTHWWQKFRGTEEPALLVVRTDAVFADSLSSVAAKARESIAVLRNVVPRIPGLSGIVMYDDPFLPPLPDIHHGDQDFQLSVGAINGCARIALFMANPRAACPLTPAEISGLIGSDMRW